MDNVEAINSLIRSYLEKRLLLNSDIVANYEITLFNERYRGVAAKRNFSNGDVIFVDTPIIAGPRATVLISPVCVGCHRICRNLKACSAGCKLPMCSLTCEKSQTHVFECEFLRRSNSAEVDGNVDAEQEKGWSSELLKAVIPIRCLQLDRFQIEIVRRLYKIKGSNQSFEVDLLKKYLKIDLQKDEEDFMRLCCCVMDANAYEVSYNGGDDIRTNLRGLYPLASFVNHNCSPNTDHVFDGDHRMIVRATKPIAAGDEISTSYCSVFLATPARRNFLARSKHFLCNCNRCRDNTEFETYLSGLRCRRTNSCDGLLLPTDPLNFQSDWTCTSCRTSLPPYKIAILQNMIANDVKSLNMDDPSSIVLFLERYNLPSTNHIMVEMKLHLVHTLGYTDGYKWNELSDTYLKLKKEICVQILDVLGKLQLGQCRIKGFCMLQFCLTLLEMQNRNYDHDRKNSANLMEEFNINEMKNEISRIYECDQFPPEDIKKLEFLTLR